MNRTEAIQHIRAFIKRKGVEPFWINSAIKHIRQGFASNTYWLSDLQNPKVKVDKFYGCVAKFTIDCQINTVSDSKPGKLTYTFGDGHKVQVQ